MLWLIAGAALLAAERTLIHPLSPGEFRPVPRVREEPWTLTAEAPSPSVSGHPRASAPPETSPPHRRQPDPAPRVVQVAHATTNLLVAPKLLGHLRGPASWYCNVFSRRGPISSCMSGHPDTRGTDRFAAAGPKLRAAICGVQSCTSWRGRYVSVNGQRVQLVDWCQCYWHHSSEKVIDLYLDVFQLTGGTVTIRW